MRSIALVLLILAGPGIGVSADQKAASWDADGDPAYLFMLGRYLEGQGRIDDAIAAHRRAIALQPDSAELRAELAGLYARQDKALDALETAESALQIDPSNTEANRILGSVYAAYADQRQALRPGENPAQYAERAIAALEKARRADSFDVGLELTLGRMYVRAGAFPKAIPPLQRVVADQPQFAEAAFLLSAAQEGVGRADDATRTMEALVRGNPGLYRGHLRLGELYERQRRWLDAADAYARAQTLNARVSGLTSRRAAALINGGNPADARTLLEPVVKAAGNNADPMQLYLLAESNRALKDLAAAEQVAKKILASNPKDARGLHVLSQILLDKGDAQGAEHALRQLLTDDPLDAIALNSLGYMLADRGERLDEAVQLLQRALEIEPDNPSYLDSLGWAYFQQGRVDLADKPLTEAAAQLQDSSVVQEHLGDLRFRQQRYEDAAAAWERALAGDGQSIDRGKIERKIRDARSKMESR